ncbi:glycosyltransferase family A protein [Adhaeribacter radiodurans]|uniref:Glycosyltransferase family 2 protein n=1 Tax=Adhaeribacter radiodurans TaxID=2745197 RepID=A0A7L7L4A8_9BACT|nr:glycosyltransferase family A protein [Adhaeribacter radiodurans]QMU27425.1 glycosyltransferase family 2 protein [Adhaeribacter radiodurans]
MKMNQLKITCSILCYNYGRFLAQAIDSCLNQTIDSSLYEVLIIDDGSTDETPEVCARYGDLIRVSRSENLGFATSLARGVKEARGEYVAYLDADDWWKPNKLENLLMFINLGALVVMHPMIEVNEKGQSLGRVGACGNTSSVCVHREAALTLLPATSEIFCRPLLDSKRGMIIKQTLGYYRIHDKAMTDRSPQSNHTEFFANTSYVTADRLSQLAELPPFWANSSSEISKLALWYRAEGVIKDFERTTELRHKDIYLSQWIKMIVAMIRGGRWLTIRELRLTLRALKHYINIKS